MCITQHTGPTASRPIRWTKQLWLSVLLKDTSAATGQAGIRTHILTTLIVEKAAQCTLWTDIDTDTDPYPYANAVHARVVTD